MGRPPCCDKSNVKKGLWTPEEDAKLLNYVSSHGIGNWTLIPKKAGLKRCGKSCRLRWTNYLRPDLKHDDFSLQEEHTIIKCHKAIGSRWSLIAKRLPGRTDNDVKNYWNTKLKKKLIKMGIDPVTHKSVSQVLSDFGKIRSHGNTSIPFGSFGNSSNSRLILKPEPSDSVPKSDSTTEMIPNPHLLINQEPISQMVTSSSSAYLYQPLFTNKQGSISIPPHSLLNDIMSPCSSSSSSSSSANICQPNSMSEPQTPAPASSFSWSQFLVPDPVFPLDIKNQEELELHGISSAASDSSTMRLSETDKSLSNIKIEKESYEIGKEGLGTTLTGATSSFIDEMLNRDNEIETQFPQLLDAYLN